MILFIILLTITFSLGGFIIYNLLRKLEQAEDTISGQQIIIENQQTYVSSLSSVIDNVDKKLTEIDNKNSFKSDDEIGWFFKEVLYIRDILNKFNLNYNAQETKPKDQ